MFLCCPLWSFHEKNNHLAGIFQTAVDYPMCQEMKASHKMLSESVKPLPLPVQRWCAAREGDQTDVRKNALKDLLHV